jgi:hypothetical protein
MTSLEIRLEIYAALLVVITGLILYERHQATVECYSNDKTAALVQSQKDNDASKETISTLQKQLAAIVSSTPSPVPIIVRSALDCLRANTTPAGTQPAALPLRAVDPSVQGGTRPTIDIGTIVQDLAYAGMLNATDSSDLWSLAIKESAK